MRIFLILSLSLIALHCRADKFWLFLPEEVCKEAYVDEFNNLKFTELHIDKKQVEVTYYSNLLHAFVIDINPVFIKRFNASGCFINTSKVKTLQSYGLQSINGISSKAQALHQMNAEILAKKGLTGKGVKIGVVDGGFYGLKSHPWLKHLTENKQVVACKNYFGRESCFDDALRDSHGVEVMAIMAGQKNNERLGLATKATYYLAHTDHQGIEKKLEEHNWVMAIEWFFENGVRLVNSSLGYSTGFDNKNDNYEPSEINGQSVLTIAAERAAQKGMIIVSAAGNDGMNNFRVVSVPSDAKSVLTIGATTFRSRKKIFYSSKGSPWLEYLKPDISSFSGQGTSFSAPVITSIIACLLELNPNLKLDSIKSMLIKSSHLYPYGNTYIGYGVPDIRKMLSPQVNSSKMVLVYDQSYEFTSLDNQVTVFHKRDSVNVIEQKVLNNKSNKFVISRPTHVKYTTLWSNKDLIEISWK